MAVVIEYEGFLQTVRREFETLEEAELWVRQVGVRKWKHWREHREVAEGRE